MINAGDLITTSSKAVCIKPDRTLGTCSDAVGGTCADSGGSAACSSFAGHLSFGRF